ncbi:MAG: glycosyltransferase [Phycisphaerae bacterium]|nr:glycosyltransferase [Phycisphaerae bacterium]
MGSSPQFVRHLPSPSPPPGAEILVANLNAVAVRQPGLADRLRAVQLGETVRFMIGRDGVATAQVRAGDEWQWLARSSAPSVSAVEVARGLAPESNNIAVFGLGSGREVRELAGRLAYHQALFCVLGDGDGLDGLPAAVAALSLVDLSDLLASGKLVLAAESGAGDLLGFLNSHAGFAPPGQVLRWPWQGAERFAAITATLDAISRRRLNAIGDALADIAGRFVQIASTPQPASQADWRVMGLATGSESPSRLAIDGLVGAARTGFVLCRREDDGMGAMSATAVLSQACRPARVGGEDMPVAGDGTAVACHRHGTHQITGDGALVFHVNGPDGAAGIAQSQAIAEFAPDLVVMIDRGRADFSPPLPERIRVATWAFDPAGLFVTQASARIAKRAGRDRVFAATPLVERALCDAGWPGECVVPLPVATDANVYRPEPCDLACDIVIIGDVAAIEPEAVGIEWASHQQLWAECARQIRLDAADYVPARAEEIVSRAMRACGVTINDEGGRAKFADAIRARLAATVIRLEFAAELRKAKATLRAVGAGWSGHGFADSEILPPPGSWADWRRLYSSARVVAFINDDDRIVGPAMLDAAACGAALLIRTPGQASGVSQMLATGQEFIPARSPAGLADRVARLLGNDSARRAIGVAARERVLREHTFAHRLRTILASM